MTGIIQKLHIMSGFIIREKYYLALVFCTVSFSTFIFLNFIGVMPSELKANSGTGEKQASIATSNSNVASSDGESVSTSQVAHSSTLNPAFPTRIRIDRVGLDAPVLNPTSILIPVLNKALTQGVVRYPEGGMPGRGNLFILGHSTSFKVVNNQAYKSFNELKNVVKGDRIIVQTVDKEYIYEVTSVRLTTSDQAVVKFGTNKNMLTLSTCNVLGAKEERYVVEADFITSRDL